MVSAGSHRQAACSGWSDERVPSLRVRLLFASLTTVQCSCCVYSGGGGGGGGCQWWVQSGQVSAVSAMLPWSVSRRRLRLSSLRPPLPHPPPAFCPVRCRGSVVWCPLTHTPPITLPRYSFSSSSSVTHLSTASVCLCLCLCLCVCFFYAPASSPTHTLSSPIAIHPPPTLFPFPSSYLFLHDDYRIRLDPFSTLTVARIYTSLVDPWLFESSVRALPLPPLQVLLPHTHTSYYQRTLFSAAHLDRSIYDFPRRTRSFRTSHRHRQLSFFL